VRSAFVALVSKGRASVGVGSGVIVGSGTVASSESVGFAFGVLAFLGAFSVGAAIGSGVTIGSGTGSTLGITASFATAGVFPPNKFASTVMVLFWISPFPSLNLIFFRTVSPSFRADASSSQVCFITTSRYFASDLLRVPLLSRMMYNALLKSFEKSTENVLYAGVHFDSSFGRVNVLMNES